MIWCNDWLDQTKYISIDGIYDYFSLYEYEIETEPCSFNVLQLIEEINTDKICMEFDSIELDNEFNAKELIKELNSAELIEEFNVVELIDEFEIESGD